jgi:hypothetical protein
MVADALEDVRIRLHVAVGRDHVRKAVLTEDVHRALALVVRALPHQVALALLPLAARVHDHEHAISSIAAALELFAHVDFVAGDDGDLVDDPEEARLRIGRRARVAIDLSNAGGDPRERLHVDDHDAVPQRRVALVRGQELARDPAEVWWLSLVVRAVPRVEHAVGELEHLPADLCLPVVQRHARAEREDLAQVDVRVVERIAEDVLGRWALAGLDLYARVEDPRPDVPEHGRVGSDQGEAAGVDRRAARVAVALDRDLLRLVQPDEARLALLERARSVAAADDVLGSVGQIERVVRIAEVVVPGLR